MNFLLKEQTHIHLVYERIIKQRPAISNVSLLITLKSQVMFKNLFWILLYEANYNMCLHFREILPLRIPIILFLYL